MMDPELDVIDAFVDGECVDREALKRALAHPEGRDYLVDVLDLRALTGDIAPAAISLPRARRRSWRSPLAAAAALVLCVTSAYFVGQRSVRPPSITPPALHRVVPAGGLMQAPAPTRIIRLDSDANWSETPGGN